MSEQLHDIPAWAALLSAFLILSGAALTLIGTIGLCSLRSFYDRIHAPTMGATLGTGSILIGSIIYFSVSGARPVLHEILIAVFLTVTTPIGLILLARAALYRDRTEGVIQFPEKEYRPDTKGLSERK